jgi:hypothetical protein
VAMTAMEVCAGSVAAAAAGGVARNGGRRTSSRQRALGHCGSLISRSTVLQCVSCLCESDTNIVTGCFWFLTVFKD